MTAKCLQSTLTDEQRRLIQAPERFRPSYQVTQGREYIVLGLSFVLRSSVYGYAPLFEICDDANRCISIPTLLFEVVDPRPSRFWLAKQPTNGGLLLWPEEFYVDFFHDDLSENAPEARELFTKVLERLKKEFDVERAHE